MFTGLLTLGGYFSSFGAGWVGLNLCAYQLISITQVAANEFGFIIPSSFLYHFFT